jgi:hypothetical protein
MTYGFGMHTLACPVAVTTSTFFNVHVIPQFSEKKLNLFSLFFDVLWHWGLEFQEAFLRKQ